MTFDFLQRTSCGYILCTVLLSVAVLLAVIVTGAVLFMNHYHATSTEPPPVITTNMEYPNALVTIERADSSQLLLSEGQSHVAQLGSSVSEVLETVQREIGSMRPRQKADLQRAPARNSRPRGCANGSKPRDCYDIYLSGQQEDGVYSVFPIHYPSGFQVFCDMTTDGGGWTVFQRREDGSVNFFLGWEQYRDGFGKLTGEHWLGLQRLHLLTMQAHYQLRIDLEDFENSTSYALYNTFGVGLFSVNPDEDGYPLTVSDYTGTAGDSLGKHSGMKFTTKDMDNDHSENNCASFYHGAWWYRNCHTSNLNGQYLRGHHASYADGVEWSSWTGWQYSLKFTEMKIRPQREEN
ncbi:hypothetical protein GDO86_014926 [Hymenochirus boettgeri]|uniref:Fibrinogen C-terminal domain-containing protein n=1 Tax=Hymenochirus boettgeri TaxID=247094 RepID=A0A8T2JTE8_9PIPI|nr:hypothetical protein GDO86_014926 [Hymenochirus boettgeri]